MVVVLIVNIITSLIVGVVLIVNIFTNMGVVLL